LAAKTTTALPSEPDLVVFVDQAAMMRYADRAYRTDVPRSPDGLPWCVQEPDSTTYLRDLDALLRPLAEAEIAAK
jgi:hypothetical protein